MKLRNPFAIRLVAFVAAWTIRVWLATVRYRLANLGPFRHPADARRHRFLYAFWHESILVPAKMRTRIRVMISRHADGELIAQVCRHLGFGVVRGSTTRGGSSALLEMTRHTQRSHLMVTPDGPRGPRRRVQPGLIYLASRTRVPIVLVGIGFSKAWRAKSWDRFALPWPFSAVYAALSEPIDVPADLDRDEMERWRRHIEERFLALTRAAERWAAHGPRPLRPPAPLADEPHRMSA